LQGDQEDGAMNYYGLAHPLRAFLAGRDVDYHPVQIDAREMMLR
jgi:alpha-glucosidase